MGEKEDTTQGQKQGEKWLQYVDGFHLKITGF